MDDNSCPGFRHYTHSGLRVASEIALPEWSGCEETGQWKAPDVVFRVLPSGDTRADRHRRQRVSATEYSLRVPEVGSFFASGGCEVNVEPMPSADLTYVRPWLYGPIWAAVCYQRGLSLVHASAVQIDGEAVLFCGAAGRGKSTLAVQLDACGYPLVCDDLCRLDLPPQGPPIIYPTPSRVKLWSDALAELGWSDRAELTPDHLRPGKFHFQLHEQAGNATGCGPGQPLPVRAAYVLGWGDFSVRELRGINAFQSFLGAASYRIPILDAMGQLEHHSRRYMEFLRRVPLAELTRPKDFQASGRTLEFLTRQGPLVAV